MPATQFLGDITFSPDNSLNQTCKSITASRQMRRLTCHHQCKRETFLHRFSVNLVGQCGKTHILLFFILQKETTNMRCFKSILVTSADLTVELKSLVEILLLGRSIENWYQHGTGSWQVSTVILISSRGVNHKFSIYIT